MGLNLVFLSTNYRYLPNDLKMLSLFLINNIYPTFTNKKRKYVQNLKDLFTLLRQCYTQQNIN